MIKFRTDTPLEIIGLLECTWEYVEPKTEDGKKLKQFMIDNPKFTDRLSPVYYYTFNRHMYLSSDNNYRLVVYDFLNIIKPYIATRKKKKCLMVLNVYNGFVNYYLCDGEIQAEFFEHKKVWITYKQKVYYGVQQFKEV